MKRKQPIRAGEMVTVTLTGRVIERLPPHDYLIEFRRGISIDRALVSKRRVAKRERGGK